MQAKHSMTKWSLGGFGWGCVCSTKCECPCSPSRVGGQGSSADDTKEEDPGKFSIVIHKVESTTNPLGHSVVFPTLWMRVLLATESHDDAETSREGGREREQKRKKGSCFVSECCAQVTVLHISHSHVNCARTSKLCRDSFPWLDEDMMMQGKYLFKSYFMVT